MDPLHYGGRERKMVGSNHQGISPRRFSRPVPSPAIGLIFQKDTVSREGLEPPTSTFVASRSDPTELPGITDSGR